MAKKSKTTDAAAPAEATGNSTMADELLGLMNEAQKERGAAIHAENLETSAAVAAKVKFPDDEDIFVRKLLAAGKLQSKDEVDPKQIGAQLQFPRGSKQYVVALKTDRLSKVAVYGVLEARKRRWAHFVIANPEKHTPEQIAEAEKVQNS